MSIAFEPAGPNYLISLSNDSANHELEITSTDNIGSAWQISNLDTANVAYVVLSFSDFDSPAVVPFDGVPGAGTAIVPGGTVTVALNTRAGSGVIGVPGVLYVSGAVDGTARITLVPGRAQ